MGQDHDETSEPEQPKPGQRSISGVWVALGTPRKLPKPDQLDGRVAVLDIAFASESGGRKGGFERTTQRFIDKLGERLVAWVDHHDSRHHALYAHDSRFTLSTKAEHGACPEMVTPAVVAAAGVVDTVVCHDDFDGLATAAKWICGGREPYPGCDADARAIDTRVGLPGAVAVRIDRALRARPRERDLRLAIVELLAAGLDDQRVWQRVDEAGEELLQREEVARRLATGYLRATDHLCIVDASGESGRYDRTTLLLLGQQRAEMAAVIDGDTVTFAAAYDSGVNFIECFGFSGGMPTLVSIHRAALADALAKLGVDEEQAARWTTDHGADRAGADS